MNSGQARDAAISPLFHFISFGAIMKKNQVLMALIGAAAVLMLSCGDKANEGNGPMDTSVIGFWEGAMEPIPLIGFKGENIYNNISLPDSAFTLIVRDTSRGVSLSIKDTTLIMAGHWRMNTLRDTILLLPDTCRIIDTTQNILVPRTVKGETFPMSVSILDNSTSGHIEWTVPVADLVPMAPLLGINLSGYPPGLLQAVRIVLYKMRQ
jgi:hypothetical protein